MEPRESVLRHPLWSGVLAGLVLAVGGSAIGYFLDWWPTIRYAIIAFWVWLGASTGVANWLLCLLAIPAAAALFLVGVAIWFKLNPDAPVKVGLLWTDYIEDQIFGLIWRWKYSGGQIVQLASFCPKCDYQVYPQHSGGFTAVDSFLYKCEGCGVHLQSINESVSYFENRVERTIQQKLRNDDWKAAIERITRRMG